MTVFAVIFAFIAYSELSYLWEGEKDLVIVSALNDIGMMKVYQDAVRNRQLYCERMELSCAVVFVGEVVLGERGSHFSKVFAVEEALEKFEYVVWMDIDAFFTEKTIRERVGVREYIPERMKRGEVDLVFGAWTKPFINSGLVIFRRSERTRRLLKMWKSTEVYKHDQPALWHAIFQELEFLRQKGHFIPYNPTHLPYTNRFIQDCSKSEYHTCRTAYYKIWSSLFPHFEGSFPFFHIHPSFPTTLPLFHCVFCPHANNSFIIHTGHTSWSKLSSLNQSILTEI